MVDIDFLPIEYHRQSARQQVKPWRVIVVAGAGLLLAAAVVAQYCQRQQAERDLAAALAVVDLASRQNANWAKFQTQLQAATSEAEFFAYLRHPWPRTQLLAAAVAPMTREITIQQIQIANETPAEPGATYSRSTAENRSRSEIKAAEEKLRKAPAAVRDAKRLRDEFDKQRCFVRIAGVTTDTAALYCYLGAVAKESFFSKVELRSIESVDTPQGPVMHFQVFLQVSPGYGQPGGPKGKSEKPKEHA